MGEVYRARDTKLNRDVAIKVLLPSVASDPDRLARFKREAQVLASLNHPNIGAIYGVEDGPSTSSGQAGISALVMELVEGEDLSQRIARGAVPIDEALPIARQIAEALEAAHDQGVVHRDLKPSNVKVRPDGTVKVLDFGLAKAAVSDVAGADAMNSPTMTAHATQGGVIIGTAAYMAPEQARGATVDRRADIWAYGAVFFEMLTGERAFKGGTTSDLVASVLRDPIDWSAVPNATPVPIKHLIARCLERDVKKRLQAIGEARLALEETRLHATRAPLARRPGRPALAAAAVVAAMVVALLAWARARTSDPAPEPGGSAPSAAKSNRSIAVLPFVNRSGNADDEYFADGMTDELIAGLGKVPGLRVAARSSAFMFKGQKTEVREVARKLGVDTLLEGAVRRSGRRLRVTASLVSASDGLQLWAAEFENDGGEPFAIQDEVTRGVVSGLSLQLAGSAKAASQAGRTHDPEAHVLYLRALALQNAGQEADLRRALELYQRAVARDPRFALAYTGIGLVHLYLADAYVPPSEAMPQAIAAARAALERDGQLADAHALLAFSLMEFGDLTIADDEFDRALALDPNSVNALLLRGFYRSYIGRIEAGLADLDRAEQIDPLAPLPPLFRELANYQHQRYRTVVEAHRRTQAIDPSLVYFGSWAGAAYRELGDYAAAIREYEAAAKSLNGAPQYGLAITLLRMGREKEARDIMRQLDERARERYVPYVTRAIVHAAVGDKDEALALLQQGIDKKENFIYLFRKLPEMAPLIKDPRALSLIDQHDPRK